MEQIRCDGGCGYFEEVGTTKSRIKNITLNIVEDTRSWSPDPVYTAQLCNECLPKMLHNYFRVPAEDRIELPAFIGESLRVVARNG